MTTTAPTPVPPVNTPAPEPTTPGTTGGNDWTWQTSNDPSIHNEPTNNFSFTQPAITWLFNDCLSFIQKIPIFSAIQQFGNPESNGGLIGDLTAGVQRIANDLIAVFNTFINAMETVNWLTPTGIIDAFKALVQFAKGLINWGIEVIKLLLGLIPPQWLQQLKQVFEIDLLHADWDQFVNTETGIDWANWAILPDLMGAWGGALTFIEQLVQWGRLVLQNISGFDIFQMFAVFDLPDLRAAFSNYWNTLKAIPWTVTGTWAPTGALWQFVSATITFFEALGHWLIKVIQNFIGDTISAISAMFSGIAAFISGVIGFVWGDAGVTNWQNALNLITGVTGAAPWDGVISIFNQFQDVLALFGNPAGIGTNLFSVTNAIENFINQMLLPTGLLGGASALAQSIVDSTVNTFLGISGTNFTASDFIRAIQSIPTKFITGSLFPGQISQVNVGILSSLIPQFLVNGSFDTPNSIIGQGLWTWDGTQGPPGFSTSVYTDAVGKLVELVSNVFAVAPGQVLNISGFAAWTGFSGPANSIALTVAQFDNTNTFLGYDTVAAIASPGAASAWTTTPNLINTAYTVPTTPAGIAALVVRPIVDATATAGRVWFGGMSAQPTATTMVPPLVPLLDASKIGSGQLAQTFVQNLTSDITTLTTGVNNAALATDLANTTSTIISALGGSGSGLTALNNALQAIPGANISGTINSVAVNIQSLVDAILSAGNPSYVAGSGTLPLVTSFLAALPQANVANLVTALSGKALASDLTALMSNLGLGTATLAAITNRLANLSAGGTMPQAAITGLVSALNATALQSDLIALMNTLGAGTATLPAITQRLTNLNTAGAYSAALPISQVTNLTGYLGHLNPSSGVLDAITSVTGLSGYLNNLSPTGVLNSIASVTGLSGYLTNLDPSTGVLSGVNAVAGLPTRLGYIASNGAISVGGLVGTISINNVPTTQLTRSNITDLGNVYTTVNTTVGSGCVITKTGGSAATLTANNGANFLPASFWDTQINAPSSDLTLNMAAGQITVSLAGWYEIEVCYKVVGSISAIWQICPVLFRNGGAARYGHDAVSFYTAATGGTTVRYIQSTFEIYLQANDYVQMGYDAANNTGTITGVLGAGNAATTYFAISLLNRSLQ